MMDDRKMMEQNFPADIKDPYNTLNTIYADSVIMEHVQMSLESAILTGVEIDMMGILI